MLCHGNLTKKLQVHNYNWTKMIENWFISDIKKQIKHHNRVVVLDPTGQYEYLINVAAQSFF